MNGRLPYTIGAEDLVVHLVTGHVDMEIKALIGKVMKSLQAHNGTK